MAKKIIEAKSDLDKLIDDLRILKAQYSVQVECTKRLYDDVIVTLGKLEKIRSTILESESLINLENQK